MYQVISLSGGKDSTAMLHMMLERGEQIDDVVFFDGGWEYPEMYEHLDLVEQKTGVKITRLKPEHGSFEWYFSQKPIVKRSKRLKGQIGKGFGFPSHKARWCTKVKVMTIDAHLKDHKSDLMQCVGIAADEHKRLKQKPGYRYPLAEYGITEAQCLAYCYNLGYTWGGLYEVHTRLSCWLCPMSSIKQVEYLYRKRPELWQELKEMEKRSCNYIAFGRYHGTAELERRFNAGGEQLRMELDYGR